MADSSLLTLEHVSKSFGSVRAVKDVSLRLLPGSVLALMGENGAGKSTIVSMILGRISPDAGTITVRGERQGQYRPAHARELGIRAVLQDFSLVPTLSVSANMFLNREPTRSGLLTKSRMRSLTRARLERVGAGHIHPETEVSQLSRAEQQLVEIAKAIDGEPGVLLLDEPTASISETESERLFAIVKRLKGEGWGILYISHRMDELRRVADSVAVIRDGRWISTMEYSLSTPEQIVHDMVGRDIEALYPSRKPVPAESPDVLRIEDLHTRDGRVRGVSVHVRAGEIVGLGGLVGCGKREVANVFFGLAEKAKGTIQLEGRPVRRPSAAASTAAGIGFIPEDRKREANVTGRSVEENVSLEVASEPRFSRWGWLRKAALRKFAEDLIRTLDVRPGDPRAAIDALSGGNQQKVVLARSLSRPRKLFILVEPTAGVDVGARSDIYRKIGELADEGAAVLMVSSDVEELTSLSDRVYVMHEGAIAAELREPNITTEAVVAAAFAHASPVERHNTEGNANA